MTKKEKAEAKAHAERCAKQWTVSQLRSAFVREYVYGREQFLKAERAQEAVAVLSGRIGALNKKLLEFVKAYKLPGFNAANWRKEAQRFILTPPARGQL